MSKSRKTTRGPRAGDIHAEVLTHSVSLGLKTLAALDPDNPSKALDSQIDDVVARTVSLLGGYDPIAVIEQARLRALPWHAGQPTYQAGIENGFACVELIALVALKKQLLEGDPLSNPSAIIADCLVHAEELLNLGALHGIVNADPDDPLAEIKATLQASEITMRGSSYSEMLEETARSLFGETRVDAALRAALSFGVREAQLVLSALNEAQTANMNRRQEYAFRLAAETQRKHELGIASEEDLADAAIVLNRALQPSDVAASVSSREIAKRTQLPDEVVISVLDAFSWTPEPGLDATKEVKAFLLGGNPFRVTPVVRTASSRAILLHPALTQGAVRERLELALHSSPEWEYYQDHRGTVLESRTRQAFDRIFGGQRSWHSILYFVPATDLERESGPSSYTKRVEGDHLIVIDDVALVIEDKAVALSPLSRSGTGSRLRKDLAGIITKAAEQADRLVQRIVLDGGVRIHGEGWLDLAHVREVHTIAVSLDDLSSTSTATAELVRSGIIGTESVPWTVSIHDLDLIVEVTAHPAEFLLYLRRRRHPLATVLFTAPDELDLFLYFLEAGLYVEEDPDEVRATYPYLSPPTPGERARWDKQQPGIVTSRTDPLDAWYFETHRREMLGKPSLAAAPPKPRRSPSPVDDLIARVDELNPFGRLSIAATLLSGDMRAQTRVARYGRDVAIGSQNGKLARSITIPMHTLHDGGWLLVWAIPSTGTDPTKWERSMRTYARAKGHQLGVARAAVFAFDGRSKEMFAVFSEAVPNVLNPDELRVHASLQPPSSASPIAQVRKTMVGQRTQPRRKGRRK